MSTSASQVRLGDSPASDLFFFFACVCVDSCQLLILFVLVCILSFVFLVCFIPDFVFYCTS